MALEDMIKERVETTARFGEQKRRAEAAEARCAEKDQRIAVLEKELNKTKRALDFNETGDGRSL